MTVGFEESNVMKPSQVAKDVQSSALNAMAI
jgi:hypothetical protein